MSEHSARFRVLLVGTDGAGGQQHQRQMYGPALAAHPAFEVTGIVEDLQASDAEWDRAAALAADLGVEMRADLTAALEHADVACVCTPYPRREEAVAAVAERGVHLLVDKPLGLSADACRRMAETARARSIVAMPAHHLRFHPMVRRLADAVARGDVGLPWGLQGEFLPAAPPTGWPHGELANFLCYPLDIARAVLAAEPRSVAAYRDRVFAGAPPPHGGSPDNAVGGFGSSGVGDADPEDMAVLSLGFDHEISVSLTLGRTPPREEHTDQRTGYRGEHRYRVMGSEGVLTADVSGPALLLDGGTRSRPFGTDSVTGLLDHLAAVLRGTASPELSLDDAVVVAEVVQAARDAADRAEVTHLRGK